MGVTEGVCPPLPLRVVDEEGLNQAVFELHIELLHLSPSIRINNASLEELRAKVSRILIIHIEVREEVGFARVDDPAHVIQPPDHAIRGMEPELSCTDRDCDVQAVGACE